MPILHRDGQALAYEDAGPPDGPVVLVQHGLIASIRDRGPFADLVAGGARVITLARPGYGDSSPLALPTIGAWGDLVAQVVDALALEAFDVFGISSGAPYAYAIAHRFPQRTRRVFVLSGTPALYAASVQQLWPYPLNLDSALPELQQLAHTLFFAHLSAEALLADDVRDSRRNACFGIAQDLAIRCRDWGFALADIRVPTVMRHSRADESVPFATAELTAAMLPSCRFDARDTDPHFSPAVLADFIATTILPRLSPSLF